MTETETVELPPERRKQMTVETLLIGGLMIMLGQKKAEIPIEYFKLIRSLSIHMDANAEFASVAIEMVEGDELN